jgi:hypothetical protein
MIRSCLLGANGNRERLDADMQAFARSPEEQVGFHRRPNAFIACLDSCAVVVFVGREAAK